MANDAYLRYPHIQGDSVAFVAENDVWVTTRDGGRAHRVSADRVPVASPRISPDGALVAWSARRNRAAEVYVAPVDGGVSTQLTFWGQERTWVRGWVSDDEVLVVSTTGEADRSRCFAHAVPVDGGPSRRLPYGWIFDIAFGPAGGVLLETANMSEPAWRKKYRGGTTGQLWLDLTGEGTFKRLFSDLTSSLVNPLWTRLPDGRQRIGFLSDHGNRCQVYSATVGKRAPNTSMLVAHTDHDYYARHATSDGEQVVYVSGGSLYLLDSLDPEARPRPIDVRLGGARAGLQPRTLEIGAGRPETTAPIGRVAPDRTARASAVEVRGTIHWLTHRDGPVRALADTPGVRRRLPVVLGGTGRVAWVTDKDGDDAIEVTRTTDDEAKILVNAGKVGRVLEMAASPDGARLAVASHDGRLLLLDVPSGEIARSARVKVVDTTTHGDVKGLAFSPDSRWLAWSAPGAPPLRQIRMLELTRPRAEPFDVTPLRFADTEPTFTTDGRHLAFLSVRSLDPVYDAFAFDLSFPNGCRPHLVPLAAETPSPFAPEVRGRAPEPLVPAQLSAAPQDEQPETRVDTDGLHQRIIPAPVAGARYSHLRAVQDGLVWLREPLRGELGDDRPRLDDEPTPATLERLDLRTGRTQTLSEAADGVEVSGDGSRVVVQTKDALRVVPAAQKVEEDDDPRVVEVDTGRLRVRVTPAAEWKQMYHEAWRLMRDHFWRADMGGVDWEAARDRYAPMLDRIASHDDLVDLIWEMHGELETSHAYCMPPLPPDEPGTRQGLLGADLAFTDGAWKVTRVVPGESSEPRARSPLTAPGVGVGAGDVIVAVDGRRTSRTRCPGSLLIGTADKPVELTITTGPTTGPDAEQRSVVVVPMADEIPLRYQDWVRDRRDYVHAQTDGRVGYLHVPDMMSGGWAQLHRDLRVEVTRPALVVDVRGNRGGHTSQLIVEKLARRIIGWAVNRGYEPESYPEEARRGPMVCVTDLYAGSDGDIVTAAIQSLGLGTVVGTRTWGGVIGIDGRYKLVDGTGVTQPRYAFWFEKFGWGVENHGVDPDVEVVTAPHDRVTGNDVQLDHAIKLVQQQLRKSPGFAPPDLPPLG